MPIEGISNIRRFPRLGKVRLGIKKEGQKGPYPSATDYFVCPDEVKAIHGDDPRELPIMFPSDDLELIAPQWYKCYSYTHGLICKGNGKTCRRKVDVDTGDFANRDTKEWEMAEGICEPEHCPMLGSKQCKKMMSLLFILPEVPGLGVYQLDTSSFYSIVNLNSQLAPDGFLRPFTRGRIAFIPFILSIEPREVTPPGVGRKAVHVLNIRADVKLADIIRISRQAPAQVLLPTLSEEEPPDDLFPDELIGGPQEPAVTATDEPVSDTDKGVTWEGLVSEGGEEPSPEVGARDAETTPAEMKLGEGKVGETILSTTKAEKATKIAVPPTDDAGEEGFHIDLTWLKESQKALKWTDDTMLTFIISQYKVSNTSVTGALNKLTREQAEDFTNQINKRVEKQQPDLFSG